MSTPLRYALKKASRPIRPSQVLPGSESRRKTASVSRDTVDHPRAATGPRRTVTAILLAAVMLVSATACGPDRGLRVEPESSNSPTRFAPATADSGEPDKPFSLDQIRKAIEDSSGVAVTGKATESAKVIEDCEDCLKFSTPFVSDDRKFQVVTVANPKQKGESVAGAVISEKNGKPRLELIATGNQLKLTPGRNGTLVVQEAMFADGDDSCCPSGWSVQVFRLHEGRFEPGQRFTRLNGET